MFDKKINFSFEFFPPTSNVLSERGFWNSIKRLSSLNPDFYSITSGITSIRQKQTFSIVKKVIKKTNINIAVHMTCINNSIAELEQIAKNYWNQGIKRIVALRGDKEKDFNNNKKIFASDLISILKKIANFDISVAAYPEVHPEAKSAHSDLMNLKHKFSCGANRAITQFFFDPNKFLRFRDKCIKNGIYLDLIPGILPVINIDQIHRFSKMSNIFIPKWIYKIFDNLSNSSSDQLINKLIGQSIITKIVENLFCEGVNQFHFYTLNQYEIPYSSCLILKMKNKFKSL
ncbi:MAG TPA: methylenetetrahydrofolate reductase [Buchnera sp. (in: enterobacteria)]|nr:methylenetetrahydrofolate reductase [Buchnera sp. (in: enterobacteria)]